MTLIVD